MTTTQQIPTYSIVEPSRQNLPCPFLSDHQIAPTSAQPLIFNTTTCNETSDQSQALYTQTLPCPVDPAIVAIGRVVSGKEQYDLSEEQDKSPYFTPFEDNLPQPAQIKATPTVFNPYAPEFIPQQGDSARVNQPSPSAIHSKYDELTELSQKLLEISMNMISYWQRPLSDEEKVSEQSLPGILLRINAILDELRQLSDDEGTVKGVIKIQNSYQNLFAKKGQRFERLLAIALHNGVERHKIGQKISKLAEDTLKFIQQRKHQN